MNTRPLVTWLLVGTGRGCCAGAQHAQVQALTTLHTEPFMSEMGLGAAKSDIFCTCLEWQLLRNGRFPRHSALYLAVFRQWKRAFLRAGSEGVR